ncbi:MAG: hypothetical protein ABFD16_26025 [Thermoguttaceae bacterium]
MARGFRFYEKKRGNRRTGSKTLGSAGEALFFASFFLVGCLGVVVLVATLLIPEWRANHEFVRHTCLVRKTRLAEKEGDGGTLYRSEIQIEYQIKGETYRIWTYDLWTLNPDGGFSANKEDQQAILQRFVPDPQRPYDCWYDAADPKTAVLVRGPHGWIWLTFIVPICFILIGGGGLIYTALNWGASAERRAALVKRAAELPAFDPGDRGKSEFPNVPDSAKITDSPGTMLAFRLPVAIDSIWGLLASLFAAVLWNSVVAVFVLWAVNAHQGKPDWFLVAFVIPFALIGIGLIAYFFRRLLLATAIGPTLVEISDHPLYPGQRYELFIQQAGRLRLKSLQVLLVCEEEATYRHGTDARTEARRVYEQPLLAEASCEVQHGGPFEAQCEVEVPAGAMHSFKADHNEVNWKILVKGNVSGWPDYERSFPIIVHPRRNGKCIA